MKVRLYWAHQPSPCATDVPSRVRTEYRDARPRNQRTGVVSLGKLSTPPSETRTQTSRDAPGSGENKRNELVATRLVGSLAIWLNSSTPNSCAPVSRPSGVRVLNSANGG